jgi:hypothetical protein
MVYNTHLATVPGVYVWTGKRWIPIGETVQEEKEEEEDKILFTIHTEDGSYAIPTSGYLNLTYHYYDWDITVDGEPVGNDNGLFYGLGNSVGILLTDLSADDHQIKITPHGGEKEGWGNAFGHFSGSGGANSTTNKQKLISIDAPLSTLAFAPENPTATTATHMFAYLFYGCTNLTTTAVIRDNYKLPEAITDLSYFLYATHHNNTSLEQPIDLTPLKDWFTNNQKITNLSYFLAYTHYGNTSLTEPIDLTPLKDWFTDNHTITNLSNFLYGTHVNNTSLEQPIDLTPLKDWFTDNQTITNLSSFLYYTHNNNTSLTEPIDLMPLKDWFTSNQTISNLSSFLYCTHYNNTSLEQPIDLMPLKDWFTDNQKINSLSYFLAYTHAYNDSLTLKGQTIFPNWVKTIEQGTTEEDTTPIQDVAGTFYQTFYLSSTKDDDTAEPQFEGPPSTPLSSLGNPGTRKYTYTNRTGITSTSIGSNWK